MNYPDDLPGFLGIDHVALAVSPGDLERQVAMYRELGFSELHREEILGSDQVREVLLQIGGGPTAIQLLSPLSPESPVAKQLEKSGGRPVIAHLALRVQNVRKAYDSMQRSGFRMIDSAPRAGSRGSMVFFVHPKATEREALGYLLEVVEAAGVQVLPNAL